MNEKIPGKDFRKRFLVISLSLMMLFNITAAPTAIAKQAPSGTVVIIHAPPLQPSTQALPETNVVITNPAECAAYATPDGFSYYSRFIFCTSWQPEWLWRLVREPGGEILAEMRARLTFFARASRLRRIVSTTIMVDNVTLSGSAAAAQFGVIFTCSPFSTPVSACSIPQDQEIFPAPWWAGGARSFPFQLRNGPANGMGNELIKNAELTASYYVSHPEASNNPFVSLWSVTYPRCDSAKYILGSGGCVISEFTPKFTLSLSGPFPQAALHKYDAIYRPQITIPIKENKVIPHLLQRTTDRRTIRRNRAISVATCRTDPAFAHINKKGKDCDEYPFASTLEGAAKGDGNYSVRWINSRQNRREGSHLGRFYNFNRVLDHDYFYVAVSP